MRDSGVKVLAIDLPEANDLTVGILALVARPSAKRSLAAQRRPGRWPGRAVCAWATQMGQRPLRANDRPRVQHLTIPACAGAAIHEAEAEQDPDAVSRGQDRRRME